MFQTDTCVLMLYLLAILVFDAGVWQHMVMLSVQLNGIQLNLNKLQFILQRRVIVDDVSHCAALCVFVGQVDLVVSTMMI